MQEGEGKGEEDDGAEQDDGGDQEAQHRSQRPATECNSILTYCRNDAVVFQRHLMDLDV